MLAIRPISTSNVYELPVQSEEYQEYLDSWYAEGRLDLFLRSQQAIWPFPVPEPPAEVPPKIGQIHWPVVGAQRFALGHLLIDYYTLGLLQSDLGDSSRVEVQMADDPDDELEVPRKLDMYLVDARPVVRTTEDPPPGTEPVEDDAWIITLVDRRWYWRQQYGRDPRVVPTWDDLFDSLFNKLIAAGTPDIDGIPSAYGDPSCRWSPASALQPFSRAALIDAAASAVGARVVCAPGDTTVYVKQPFPSYADDLITWHDTVALLNRHTAGGPTEATVVYPKVPERVRVGFLEDTIVTETFQDVELTGRDVEISYESISLASLSLTSPDANKVVEDTELVLWSDLPGDSTVTEINAAAQQLAESFYVWQTAPLDAVYVGFILPPANAFIGDVIFYHSATEGHTRVSRPPVNWNPTYWLDEPGPFGSCDEPEDTACDCDQCDTGSVTRFVVRFSGTLPAEFEGARGVWQVDKLPAEDPDDPETPEASNCVWLSEEPEDHPDWSLYLEYDGTAQPAQAGVWTLYLLKSDGTIWGLWSLDSFDCCDGPSGTTFLDAQTTGSDPTAASISITAEGDCGPCDETTTTTTTTTAGPAACTGDCKFDWNITNQKWELTTNPCDEENACFCIAPDFCPLLPQFSACVYTKCGQAGGPQQIPNCTGTTTTDGACLTTTTTTGAPGVCQYNPNGSCSWFCHPTHGWVQNTWDPVPPEEACGKNCPGCPLPPYACDVNHWCETEITLCAPPPPPPPPPSCTGGCYWVWTSYPDGSEDWELIRQLSECVMQFPADPYDDCRCDKPEPPAVAPECGTATFTACYFHVATTTTPGTPGCSTPQPPHTTTIGQPGDCSGRCSLRSDGSNWVVLRDCGGDCGCAEPLDPPTDSCQVIEVPCLPPEFTTTTTTPGGCTPCGAGDCMWECGTDGEWHLTNETSCPGGANCGCSYPLAAPCTEDQEGGLLFISGGCCFGGTTTTTTTTTTTAGPTNCGDSFCQYRCNGSAWELENSFCFVGCTCPDPGTIAETCGSAQETLTTQYPCGGGPPSGCVHTCSFFCGVSKNLGELLYGWAQTANGCTGQGASCECGYPEEECNADRVGTVEEIPCGQQTTTTTTTTTASGDWFCWECMAIQSCSQTEPDPGNCVQMTGPHADEAACLAAGCVPP